jgi:hemerythrin-like domain-containing protein
MSDVFEVLAADHADVKRMLTALEDGPDRTAGASDAVLDARTLVAQWLVIDSSRHETAEEQYFWPAVRKHIGGGDHLADKAIGQESEAKEVLDKLNKLDARDAKFDELLAEFIPAAREHIDFEEGEVWPKLRALLSAEDSAELGKKVSKAKEHGPTRPHPHTPASPAVLKTAGSAAAVLDQLRDAISGRGKTA